MSTFPRLSFFSLRVYNRRAMTALNALWGEAVAAFEAGQLGRADMLCRKILKKNDRAAAVWRLLGAVAMERGRLAEAIAHLERAVRLAPDDAEMLSGLAAVLLRAERAEAAEDAARRALGRDPTSLEALFNLALALQAQCRWGEAERAFRALLDRAPTDAAAWTQLGEVRLRDGRPGEAAAAFRAGLRHDPAARDGRRGLVQALLALDRMDAARALIDDLLTDDPADAGLRLARLNSFLPRLHDAIADESAAPAAFAAELERTIAHFTAADADERRRAFLSDDFAPPFPLTYHGGDITRILCRFGDLTALLAGGLRAPMPSPAAGPPWRVGIVSGFLREHAAWGVVMRGHADHLDPERFTLFAYHTAAATDAATEALRARCRRFVQGPLPLDRWAAEIAADRPHVLLFPELMGDATAYRLAALRLAPVQAAFFGHPTTSGLPTVDLYFSADRFEAPDGARHYREALVRLTNLTSAMAAPQPIGKITPPALAGVDFHRPLALCCQTLIKYRAADDGLLAAIAAAAPTAQFVFVADAEAEMTARLTARLARAGLAADRLIVIPRLPPADFAALCANAALYLDTPGFSSYNTALVALAAGLPVMTLEGDFLRGRLAAGLLRRVGCADLIAADRDQYAALAARLLNQPTVRAAAADRIRAGLPGLAQGPEPTAGLARHLAERLAVAGRG